MEASNDLSSKGNDSAEAITAGTLLEAIRWDRNTDEGSTATTYLSSGSYESDPAPTFNTVFAPFKASGT